MEELEELFSSLETVEENICIKQESIVDNKISYLSSKYADFLETDSGELEEMLIKLKEFMFEVYKIMH